MPKKVFFKRKICNNILELLIVLQFGEVIKNENDLRNSTEKKLGTDMGGEINCLV
jgi:hypothetical protein